MWVIIGPMEVLCALRLLRDGGRQGKGRGQVVVCGACTPSRACAANPAIVCSLHTLTQPASPLGPIAGNWETMRFLLSNARWSAGCQNHTSPPLPQLTNPTVPQHYPTAHQ